MITKNTRLVLCSIVVCFGLIWLSACTSDQALAPLDSNATATFDSCGIAYVVDASQEVTPEVSFAEDIVPLLLTYCYYPGGGSPGAKCHYGESPNVPHNFSTYEGVFDTQDRIYDRSISIKDMPPSYNEEGPKVMEECDLLKLQLWLDAGAPNN
ncbi:MAG: hypothetical protein ACPGXL_01445 [Chitinophagales bacterium]